MAMSVHLFVCLLLLLIWLCSMSTMVKDRNGLVVVYNKLDYF